MRSYLISSALVALIALAFYIPQIKFNRLLGKTRIVEDLFTDKCSLIQGPKYCEDIALHRPSGWAFISCDTSRPIYNPSLNIWNDSVPITGGEIWIYNINKLDNLPIKLNHPFKKFHPLGIAISPFGEAGLNDPKSLDLLIINYPKSFQPVIEFVNVNLELKNIKPIKTIIDEGFIQPSRLRAVRDQRDLKFDKNNPPSFYFTDSYFYNPLWDNSSIIWKMARKLEEKINLPLSILKYYIASGQIVTEIGWRLSRATGITFNLNNLSSNISPDGFENPRMIYVSSSYQGKLIHFRHHFLSLKHQISETIINNIKMEILIPSYLALYEVDIEFPFESIDIDSKDRYIFGIGSPKHGDYQKWAKKLQKVTNNNDKGAISTLLKMKPPTGVVVIGSRSPKKREGKNIIIEEFEETYEIGAPNVISHDKDNAARYIQRYFTNIPILISTQFGTGSGIVVNSNLTKMLISGSYEEGILLCSLDENNIRVRIRESFDKK